MALAVAKNEIVPTLQADDDELGQIISQSVSRGQMLSFLLILAQRPIITFAPAFAHKRVHRPTAGNAGRLQQMSCWADGSSFADYHINESANDSKPKAKEMKQRQADDLQDRVRGAEGSQRGDVTVHDAIKKHVAVSADESTHKGDVPRDAGFRIKQSQGKLADVPARESARQPHQRGSEIGVKEAVNRELTSVQIVS